MEYRIDLFLNYLQLVRENMEAILGLHTIVLQHTNSFYLFSKRLKCYLNNSIWRAISKFILTLKYST